MKPIILIDHESNDLYIAEIKKKEDMGKIIKEREKLNEEQRKPHERADYYDELSHRTDINIYLADFLFI